MPLSCSLAPPARGGCRCGLVGSIVLRATFSPAAELLQLLVVRLLAAFSVLHRRLLLTIIVEGC